MKRNEIYIPKHWLGALKEIEMLPENATTNRYDLVALTKKLADFGQDNRFICARAKLKENTLFHFVYDFDLKVVWLMNPVFALLMKNQVMDSVDKQQTWLLPTYQQTHSLFVDSTRFEGLKQSVPPPFDLTGLFFYYDELELIIKAFDPAHPKLKMTMNATESAQLFLVLPMKLETFVSDFVCSDLYETRNETGDWLTAEHWRLMSMTAAGFTMFCTFLSQLDDYQANLPALEKAWLEDTNKGLWELYWDTRPNNSQDYIKLNLPQSVEVRNPELDIRQNAKIGIDFGTSSTVVAVRQDGRTELLRVGVADFLAPPKPSDYQNPTLLEFKDFTQLIQKWQTEVHRPLLKWGEEIRLSHEALHVLRGSLTDAKTVSSMLSGLKQFPLTERNNAVVRLVDQKGREFHIPKVICRDLVKGEPLTVSAEDAFDPIELYAYYLGLFINNRHSGIYLNYYMTFPVGYEKEVRQTILASFKRGLLRSLPATLWSSPNIEKFNVVEVGTEPVAYAAAALDFLKKEEKLILPNEHQPLYYAIFDFGGGTTDFDFGEYRLATDEELEEEGYEEVLKHYGASGDKFLGGENLIENLAYKVFEYNQNQCREKHIQFTCPLDAVRFPGSEMLINHSWIAKANTTVLMSALRPLWVEYGKYEKEEDILENLDEKGLSLTLFDNEGNPREEYFELPFVALKTFLSDRVYKGIKAFFSAMKEAFNKQGKKPEKINILLAGNASNSVLVQDIFTAIKKQLIPQKEKVQFIEFIRDLKHEIAILKGEAIPILMEEEHMGPFEKLVKIDEIRAILQREDEISFPELEIYKPLQENNNNLFGVTGKTGVAIGALKLVPGETLKVEEPQGAENAPFQFFVGRYLRDVFKRILSRNDEYNIWYELGKPIRNAFVLVYTQDTRVVTESIRRGEKESLIREITLEFEGDMTNKRLFLCAKAPNEIEIVLADSLEEAQNDGLSCTQYRKISLL